MKVFLGSSSETESEAYCIGNQIKELGHTPIPWFKPDVFPGSVNTLDSLIKISEEVDCAVFIFAGDDKIENSRGNYLKPRDNVLIEYGLFVGMLCKENVAILRKDNSDIASDLAGIKYINMDFTFEQQLRCWLDNVNIENNMSRKRCIAQEITTPLSYSETAYEKVENKPIKSYGTDYKLSGVIGKSKIDQLEINKKNKFVAKLKIKSPKKGIDISLKKEDIIEVIKNHNKFNEDDAYIKLLDIKNTYLTIELELPNTYGIKEKGKKQVSHYIGNFISRKLYNDYGWNQFSNADKALFTTVEINKIDE